MDPMTMCSRRLHFTEDADDGIRSVVGRVVSSFLENRRCKGLTRLHSFALKFSCVAAMTGTD